MAGGESAGPRASRPHMPEYGLAAADAGKGLLPWAWAVERLQRPRNYFVATVRTDGAPHAMPVWGVWLEDAFFFSTARGSRKARNIAADGRCVVLPDRGDDAGDEALIVEGVASEVTDMGALARLKEAYDKKYAWDLDTGAGPIVVVRPRIVFAFGALGDFTGSATRWTFDAQS